MSGFKFICLVMGHKEVSQNFGFVRLKDFISRGISIWKTPF